MEYGAIVNLVEWYGTLIAIMEHGVLQIPVNERAMMKMNLVRMCILTQIKFFQRILKCFQILMAHYERIL